MRLLEVAGESPCWRPRNGAGGVVRLAEAKRRRFTILAAPFDAHVRGGAAYHSGMDLAEVIRQIEARRWEWDELPDDVTEGLLSRLLANISPHVPAVQLGGDGGWTNSGATIVLRSAAILPESFHNDLQFWEAFEHEALYVLYASFSRYSRVYTRHWNVFPTQGRRELLRMTAEQRRDIQPTEFRPTHDPYGTLLAPTAACRTWEDALHEAFRNENLWFVPDDALDSFYAGGGRYAFQRGPLHHVFFGFS